MILKLHILACMVLSLLLSTTAFKRVDPLSQNMDPTKLQEAGKNLDDLVAQGYIPGAALLVLRDGEEIYRHETGYANIEEQVPYKLDTIGRMLSMSKPITSVAFMQLVEEGKINLDDPLSKYAPMYEDMEVYVSGSRYFYDSVPAKRQITIRDCMTHTSGLSYGPLFGDTPVDNMYPVFRLMLGDIDNFAETIADYPLLYQPGTTWHYSFSYDVLGYVIQEVSGIELSKYMQENVFDPLGLQDTGFHVPNEKLNRWSTAYETNQETGELSASMNPLINSQMTGEKPNLISAGGGILSTANDYAKITQMLLNGGELDGIRLLKSETVDLMWRDQLPPEAYPMYVGGWESTPNVAFGLGFSVNTDRENILDIDWSKHTGDKRIGEINWGGGASTTFFTSADNQVNIILMTQKLEYGNQLDSAYLDPIHNAIMGPSKLEQERFLSEQRSATTKVTSNMRGAKN